MGLAERKAERLESGFAFEELQLRVSTNRDRRNYAPGGRPRNSATRSAGGVWLRYAIDRQRLAPVEASMGSTADANTLIPYIELERRAIARISNTHPDARGRGSFAVFARACHCEVIVAADSLGSLAAEGCAGQEQSGTGQTQLVANAAGDSFIRSRGSGLPNRAKQRHERRSNPARAETRFHDGFPCAGQ